MTSTPKMGNSFVSDAGALGLTIRVDGVDAQYATFYEATEALVISVREYQTAIGESVLLAWQLGDVLTQFSELGQTYKLLSVEPDCVTAARWRRDALDNPNLHTCSDLVTDRLWNTIWHLRGTSIMVKPDCVTAARWRRPGTIISERDPVSDVVTLRDVS